MSGGGGGGGILSGSLLVTPQSYGILVGSGGGLVEREHLVSVGMELILRSQHI